MKEFFDSLKINKEMRSVNYNYINFFLIKIYHSTNNTEMLILIVKDAERKKYFTACTYSLCSGISLSYGLM